jgi:probable HAF family extracellular repeat protein
MGEAPQPAFGSSAFLWHKGKVTDLGLLPGTTAAEARGVNSHGQACGIAYEPGGPTGIIRYGFLWSNGILQDIGNLPGYTQCRALDINDLGQIIGRSELNSGSGEPFIWHNGAMHALNNLIPPELGLTIGSVLSINNLGQIVGIAYDEPLPPGQPNQVGIILTPIPSPIGDSDCDEDVDVDDLLTVINHWADASPKGSSALPPGDFNHDAIVGVDDLMIVIDNWTK